jgi:ceramide glucosyltransferase
MSLPSLWQIIEIVSEICLAIAALGSVYVLITAMAVLRFRRGEEGDPAPAPEPVSILKPLHGPEPGLLQRLAANCEQDYAAPVQLVCGVQDGEDPAVGAVGTLAEQSDSVDLVIDARRRGTNPKISNLANMLPKARHDLLMISDSDVEVGPDYLRNITAELAKPGVGAVSCLYYGVPASRWGRLSALGINTHFLPNVVLALSLGMAEPCFGTTIALRKSLLQRIGGFEAFGNVLADDYAVGQAVRSAGYRIGIPSFALGHACFDRSLGTLMAHDVRVARTIKTIDPIGYYGLIITHPFALALLGAFAGVGDALLVATIALASRLLLCHCIARRFQLPRQDYWLVPVRDLLSFTAYVRGLFGSAVNWRGTIFRVSRRGDFVPAAQPEQVPSA